MYKPACRTNDAGTYLTPISGAQARQDMAGLREQLQAVEQPDSGLLRTMIMQDQKDPDAGLQRHAA